MATSMIPFAALPQKSRPVRAPFRLLAGFIYLTGTVAVLGTAYMAWRSGTQLVPANSIIWLPGIAWLMGLTFHAAVHGTAPDNEHWPFASARVASVYYLIVLFFTVCTTR